MNNFKKGIIVGVIAMLTYASITPNAAWLLERRKEMLADLEKQIALLPTLTVQPNLSELSTSEISNLKYNVTKDIENIRNDLKTITKTLETIMKNQKTLIEYM